MSVNCIAEGVVIVTINHVLLFIGNSNLKVSTYQTDNSLFEASTKLYY